MEGHASSMHLRQHRADAGACSDLELEARLAAHGFSDCRLGLVVEVVVIEIELCRQQHALRGRQSKGIAAARTFVREELTRTASAIAVIPVASYVPWP